jgi:electron transfer flavoprotein alpha subunit
MKRHDLTEYSGILVYGKIGAKGPSDGLLELLGEANRLKERMNTPCTVSAACIGDTMEKHYDTLFHFGAQHIYAIDDPRLKTYQPHRYAEALYTIINVMKPDTVLVCASMEGGEMASAVAARFQTGLAAHCVQLNYADGELVQVVPAFAGKILGDIYCPETRPRMSTIKEGMFQKLAEDTNLSGTVEKIAYPIPSLEDRIELISSHTEGESTEKQLNKAEFVVGGGLGIGSRGKWSYLEQFAQATGAALGCTRPALDQHWVHDERSMIGTSGVVVKPKLYMSVGISGASHHVCGIQDAELTIAINNDPNAPIFSHADFGVCEDWEQIVPLLTQKIMQRKEG